MLQAQTDIQAGAVFSPCRRYRYRLWRVWDTALPQAAWVMFNPSTADASRNDPTIRNCMEITRRHGFGGLVVVNICAQVATDHKDLFCGIDRPEGGPIGPDNERHLQEALDRSGRIVLAWGNLRLRGSLAAEKAIKQLLTGRDLWCLGLTRDGNPRHPARLGYSVAMVPFTGEL